MKITNHEKVLFILYAAIFIYAGIIQFGRNALPFSSIAVPVGMTIFFIFLIHIFNIIIRNK